MAPRMISCMTSSIPSEPASRTYSMCGTSARLSGSPISRSKNALSNFELMNPARGPWSWWLMPPVPQTWTVRSSP